MLGPPDFHVVRRTAVRRRRFGRHELGEARIEGESALCILRGKRLQCAGGIHDRERVEIPQVRQPCDGAGIGAVVERKRNAAQHQAVVDRLLGLDVVIIAIAFRADAAEGHRAGRREIHVEQRDAVADRAAVPHADAADLGLTVAGLIQRHPHIAVLDRALVLPADPDDRVRVPRGGVLEQMLCIVRGVVDRNVQVPDRAEVAAEQQVFRAIDRMAVAVEDAARMERADHDRRQAAREQIPLRARIDVVHQEELRIRQLTSLEQILQGVDRVIAVWHAARRQRLHRQQAQRQGDGQKPCQNSLSHLFIPPCRCWGVFF